MVDRNAETTPRPDDLLAAYELGLLNEEERLRFEAATRDDPALLDELYDAAPLTVALRRDPARFQRAAKAVRSSLATRLSRAVASFLQPRIAVPAVTAALALVLLILVPEGGTGLGRLAVLDPLQVATVQVRAGAPASDELFVEALDDYREARWSAAADGLDRALSQAPADWSRADQARLYRGSSLLLDGDPVAAEPLLSAAAESVLPPVRERAAWQLVQARLLRGDENGVRKALAGLLESPVYGERVQALETVLNTR